MSVDRVCDTKCMRVAWEIQIREKIKKGIAQ